MSKKNNSSKRTGKPVTQSNANKQPPKRKFLRRATALHCFTFITCFSLFILLSIHLANQPLMESRPNQINGWLMINDPETGKSTKTEFSCPMETACELARLFDDVPNSSASSKLEKYGEINFVFTKKRADRKFFIAQDGIRDSQGWYRHKSISPETVRELILNGMKKNESLSREPDSLTAEESLH
ncbi:MAG: hypothetical protein E7028_06635 [Planctomycetaceae bacterium]|nr:hypothetical protein [Planctomycetaceae bacterium]MBQ2820685.1 hypothetical protein [Thermoguttaceae bacterium]